MANILTFANDTLTDANIFGGIHYICDLNTGDEFSIGNTASGYVSFVTDVQLPLYTKDAVNGTFVWEQDSVTRGKFYITEVTRDKDKYMVTAYDAMILLETSISALSLSFPLTVSAAASAIATYIGCAISGTINNGTLTADSIEDTTTCRTVLGWVAEASGCSVKIDSSDHLCFMYYTDSGITVSASDYKEDGLNVADYTCAAIDNVTILDMAGMTHATAGSGTNSLFIMGNPFMYEATNTEAATILSLVEDFEYAPFTCEMFEENGLEVGTIATFGTTTTLVMHIESGEGGAVASAVGSDSRAELNKSLDIMINEALSAASNAQDQVDALNLHFWYTATGSEAGAHIAEVSKPTFEANPSGGNLLSSSNGIAVRDGLTELATFGADGARIGEEGETSITITPNTIEGRGEGGKDFFSFANSGATLDVTKTRDIKSDAPLSELTSISETIPETPKTNTHVTTKLQVYNRQGTQRYANYVFDCRKGTAKQGSTTFTIDSTSYTFSCSYNGDTALSFALSPSPSSAVEAIADLTYSYVVEELAPSFRFGGESTVTGGYSLVAGYGNSASNDYSFACGLGNKTYFAGGATVGKYSATAPLALFVVGMGTSDENRENALVVDNIGDILLKADANILAAITALGWENDVIV